MKLLNVLYLFPCSSETFISLLLAELGKRDWISDILAERDPRQRDQMAREDLEPETQVHQHVISSGLLSRVSYFQSTEKLHQQLNVCMAQEDGYDLVLFHWADFLAVLLEREMLLIPVVVSCHEPDFTESLSLFEQRERVLERVSAIIVEGRYQIERLLELGYPRERLLYWKIGVDMQEIDTALISNPLAVATGIVSSTLRLVSAGRFVEKKGFLQALEAVSKLRDRGFSLTYDLVGDGEQRGDIKRLIERRCLQKLVQLPGKVMHPELFDHLVVGDINLIPSGTASNGDREGVMSTVLEAMACSSVVISTRHGGTAEIIEHGVTGWLLDDNRAETIAEALEYLWQRPALRRQLGQAASTTLRERFELQNSITHFQRFLGEVRSSAR